MSLDSRLASMVLPPQTAVVTDHLCLQTNLYSPFSQGIRKRGGKEEAV